MSEPLKGFITYSHENTEAKNELRKRLAVMEQNNELGCVYLSTPDPVMTRLPRFCKTFSALQTILRYSLTSR